MNAKDDFALVPKPPSSLEKAEPGAKRILSGMVADTLALAKTASPAKREVHVLIVGTPEFNECFSFLVTQADEGFGAHFQLCVRMDDLTAALKQFKFGLALVQMHRTPPAEHSFADQREILRRVENCFAENDWVCWVGPEITSFLRSVHRIPVVMVSDAGGNKEAERLLAAQVGAHALFSWLGTDIQAFFRCVRSLLLQNRDEPRKP